jgi:hypothetical protein
VRGPRACAEYIVVVGKGVAEHAGRRLDMTVCPHYPRGAVRVGVGR